MLLRLVYAQTRAMNEGKQDYGVYGFSCSPRTRMRIIQPEVVSGTLEQWKRNQPPYGKRHQEVNFAPIISSKRLSLLEGSGIDAVESLRNVADLETIRIALLCPGSKDPGGEVGRGQRGGEEEELYRRTDVAWHVKPYVNREVPYPLNASLTDEGRALMVSDVLCYREGLANDYSIMKKPFLVDIIFATPSTDLSGSKDPITKEKKWEQDYKNLKAAFDAAVFSRCKIFVLSYFGCEQPGHPPEEVASVMYKVIYEYQACFNMIVLSVSSGTPNMAEVKKNYDMFQKVFWTPESALLYWNGDCPRHLQGSNYWHAIEGTEAGHTADDGGMPSSTQKRSQDQTSTSDVAWKTKEWEQSQEFRRLLLVLKNKMTMDTEKYQESEVLSSLMERIAPVNCIEE